MIKNNQSLSWSCWVALDRVQSYVILGSVFLKTTEFVYSQLFPHLQSVETTNFLSSLALFFVIRNQLDFKKNYHNHWNEFSVWENSQWLKLLFNFVVVRRTLFKSFFALKHTDNWHSLISKLYISKIYECYWKALLLYYSIMHSNVCSQNFFSTVVALVFILFLPSNPGKPFIHKSHSCQPLSN